MIPMYSPRVDAIVWKVAVIFQGLVDIYKRGDSGKKRTRRSVKNEIKPEQMNGSREMPSQLEISRIGLQIHANTEYERERRGKSARTIYSPVAFAVFVLSKRNELQLLLTMGITRRRWYGRCLRLLVFVVNYAPGAIYHALDLRTMAQLQFHQLTKHLELEYILARSL